MAQVPYPFITRQHNNALAVSGVAMRSGIPVTTGDVVPSYATITSNPLTIDWDLYASTGNPSVTVDLGVTIDHVGNHVISSVDIDWGDGDAENIVDGYGVADPFERTFRHVYTDAATGIPTIQVVANAAGGGTVGTVSYALTGDLPFSALMDVDQIRVLQSDDALEEDVLLDWRDITDDVPVATGQMRYGKKYFALEARTLYNGLPDITLTRSSWVPTSDSNFTLSVSRYPRVGVSTGVLVPTILVDALDDEGQRRPDNVPVQLSVLSGPGALSGITTVNMYNGRAPFVVGLTSVGIYTLRASATGYSPASFGPIQIVS